MTHSAIASCATLLFFPHFDVFCLNRRSATWNEPEIYFANLNVLTFSSGERFLARTRDSTYSHGNVTQDKETTFLVTFDSGDITEYSYEDKTAVTSDSIPAWINLGDHVLAMSIANGIEQYLVGFVSADFCRGQDKEYYEITLDRNHQVGNYTIDKLRKLPFFSSVHQGDSFSVCY